MGTRERRQRESEQRRRSILEAARTIFWKEGYAGTTVPFIAACAQLAPGTLYLYFPGKDAIYAELLHEGYDILLRCLREAVRPAASPRQQASAIIDVFCEFAREHPEYFDILFFVLQKEGGKREDRLQPQQAQALKDRENECKHFVLEVLRRSRYGDPDECARAVDALWSMLAGVIFSFRNDRNLAAIVAEAKTLLLAAVFQ
jgi:AcrR family transcriptional regulator